MKSVCAVCGLSLHVEESGITVFEMFQNDEKVYRIWQADKWKCRKCFIEIILGFGNQPLSEHFEDGFEKIKAERLLSGNVYYWYEKAKRTTP